MGRTISELGCGYGPLAGRGHTAPDAFDALQQPQRFICTIDYALMANEELGQGAFIKPNERHPSVALADATTGEDVTLELEASPVLTPRAIVSRGIFCRSATYGQIFMEIRQATAKE